MSEESKNFWTNVADVNFEDTGCTIKRRLAEVVSNKRVGGLEGVDNQLEGSMKRDEIRLTCLVRR